MSITLQLRKHVDCVYTTQQGLDGAPRSTYALVDYMTGFRAPLAADEAEIVMALRRSTRLLSPEQLREEIRQSSGQELAATRIAEVIASLERLGLTAAGDADAASLRERQRTARRSGHQASQLARLNEMLGRLSRDVPYYQGELAQKGTHVDGFEDLGRYGIITKAQIRTNLPRLQPSWFSADRFAVRWMSSSGATDSRTQTVHLADQFNRGYSSGFSALGLSLSSDSFRVGYLAPPVCSGSECHMDMSMPYEKRLQPNGRILYLNSFRNPSTVPDAMIAGILEEVRAFQPQLLAVDASYLVPVALYLARRGETLPFVKAIVTSYGITSGLHVQAIRSAFSCPIRDLYSMTETGPIGGLCEKGLYHVLEPCHVEILGDDGAPVAPGQVGKVVVTTLENRLTPLLRYETGDVARATAKSCECGLGHLDVFEDLEGRSTDTISDAAGARLTPRQVDRAVTAVVGFDAVQYYALIQKGERSYQLVLKAGDAFTPAAEEALRGSVLGLLGSQASLGIDRVASVPPSRNGKYRLCHRDF
jgi:phenylacetate-CoA ligase